MRRHVPTHNGHHRFKRALTRARLAKIRERDARRRQEHEAWRQANPLEAELEDRMKAFSRRIAQDLYGDGSSDAR